MTKTLLTLITVEIVYDAFIESTLCFYTLFYNGRARGVLQGIEEEPNKISRAYHALCRGHMTGDLSRWAQSCLFCLPQQPWTPTGPPAGYLRTQSVLCTGCQAS